MDLPVSDARLHAPAALRNRDPILAILKAHLPPEGLLLEIASGSGEHCIHFARALPGYILQPSDRDPKARASITAWTIISETQNIRPPLAIDTILPGWTEELGAERPSAIICINMIHISPWEATRGLFSGAASLLLPGQLLFTYGPYKREGRHTSESNARFDADLRRENPQWGIRDLEEVTAYAEAQGFSAPEVTPMPANNLTLVFRRL